MRGLLLALLCALPAQAAQISNPRPPANILVTGGGSDPTKVPLAGGVMTGELRLSSANLVQVGTSSFIYTMGEMISSTMNAQAIYGGLIIQGPLLQGTTVLASLMQANTIQASIVQGTLVSGITLQGTLVQATTLQAYASVATPVVSDISGGGSIRIEGGGRVTINDSSASSVDASLVIQKGTKGYHLGSTNGPALLFGGTYATCAPGIPCYTPNVITGTCSCPTGFTGATAISLPLACPGGVDTAVLTTCYQQ